MNGKRTPELGAGVLEVTFEKLARVSELELLESCGAFLPPHRRGELLSEWSTGIDHLSYSLELKTGYVKQLQTKSKNFKNLENVMSSNSLGCWLGPCTTTPVGRDVARLCLEQWDRVPLAFAHHRLVAPILAQDSPLRQQLERFVSGEAELQSMPDLWSQLLPLKFAPITERSMEAQHGKVAILVPRSSRMSLAAVSLANRMPEFLHIVDHDPGFLHTVADHLDNMRNGRDIAETFRPHRHPSLDSLHHTHVHDWHAPVVRLFYRCQPDDQYKSMAQAVANQRKRQLELKDEAKNMTRAALAAAAGAPLVAPDHDGQAGHDGDDNEEPVAEPAPKTAGV